MPRNRKEKESSIKLKQPDRSEPSQQTLLDLAEQRGLLADNNGGTDSVPADEDPLVGRFGESFLWSTSLTMLHFTLDVLVANQYAVDLDWPHLFKRQAQAFPVIFFLFYSFHPHAEPSVLLPRLPLRYQHVAHQVLFLASAVFAGCYLIYTTNTFSYYAVMKRAPPMGILWIWSVIELDLLWALGSLACCGLYLTAGGYSVT